ncbi:MAG: hypothetical protein A2521_04405 [Deltaproteobacteria bacterium RIFOXYD12_FULL_57_12]|nr:MAG: hypothetical protein A2521_04405 [Deltaproteobacteria bacterium RIFOXYD12_FULL_57_12]
MAGSVPFGVDAAAYLVKTDGEILWARDASRRLPPASLTKLMTVLLALRQVGVDEVVTVGKRAAAETGSRLGLREGEEVYAGFLVAAALMASANDACLALAEQVAGSESAFVAMMNRAAAGMGLQQTHFTNACGHDSAGHLSSAADLATLAEAALQQPLIAALAAEVKLDIDTRNSRRVFHLTNKNELIGRYSGAVGLKTGFTARAGKCLVAVADRQEHRVLLVLLNAPDRWWSAVRLLDAAFAGTGR